MRENLKAQNLILDLLAARAKIHPPPPKKKKHNWLDNFIF